jgi:replication factor C small subunit
MKVIILDECDYITPNAQAALRNLMETFSKNCRFILTCNYVERIIDPIQSRCQSFQIIPPDRKQVAQHLANILGNENIEYDIKDIATIVNGGYPDVRRVINGAQRQVVNGNLVIDENTITQNDYKTKVLEILTTQDKKSSFQNIRQLLADSKVTDFSDLFRLMFDTIDDWGQGHIAECILILSKYQQSDAVVVDKEINIMAMFVEIIGSIK